MNLTDFFTRDVRSLAGAAAAAMPSKQRKSRKKAEASEQQISAAARRKAILEFVQQNPGLSSAAIAKQFGISRDLARHDLGVLEDACKVRGLRKNPSLINWYPR